MALPRGRVPRAFAWLVGRALAAGTSPAQALRGHRRVSQAAARIADRDRLSGQLTRENALVPTALWWRAARGRAQASPGGRATYDRDRVLVDIHVDQECARLVQGGPPRAWSIVPGTGHEATLAAGALTRDCPGGQRIFPGVIRSGLHPEG
jgi:hypothetical protein